MEHLKKDFRLKIVISTQINTEFWAIIPALNINIHSKDLEFEWLCIAFYIGFLTDAKNYITSEEISYEKSRRNPINFFAIFKRSSK